MQTVEPWDGAVPCRFGLSRRHLGIPHIEPASQFLSPPNGLLAFSAIGLEEVKAKRHFNPSYSPVQRERRLCFQKVARSLTAPRVESVKHMQPEFTQARPRPQRRHVQQEISEPREPQLHMHMVKNEMGFRPQDRVSGEREFHSTELGRKIRVAYPAKQNTYVAPECEPDFFRKEGLFPNGIYKVRPPVVNKAASGLYETVKSYAATGPKRTKWRDRLRQSAQDLDKSDVSGLVPW